MDAITAIGSNPAAGQTARIMAEAFIRLQQTIGRLSSGKRLNSPDADAAGLAQLEKLTSQVSQIDAGSSNVANAVSFTEVQSSAVQQLVNAQNRMGELAIRAQDATLTDSDRQALQAEFAGLQGAQNQILSQKFNDVPIFSSTNLQVTADGEGTNIALASQNLGAAGNAGGIGDTIAAGTTISTAGSAATALNTIKTSLDNLARGFAQIGAGQSQLGITRETNAVRAENLTAAASRIGDADVATESTNLSRFSAATQTGALGLARANAAPGFILNLLA